MRVAFCHHLSLRYGGGGERWVAETAQELSRRGHEVEVYCLPFTLKGSLDVDPAAVLGEVPYHEGWFHRITADVAYVTYIPQSWLFFNIKAPKVAGIHSQAYWHPLKWEYGLLPNIAILSNAFTSRWELGRFKVVHMVSDEFPLAHKDIRVIPNFVDGDAFKPTVPKAVEFTVAFASRKVWQKGYDTWTRTQELMEGSGIRFVESGGLSNGGLVDLLSESHVVVVPSRVDTFGLGIVEAAMCGCIPITSSLIAHRALGLPLFYADSPEEYVRRILEVKAMWESGVGEAYSAVLRRQAERFDKKLVMNKLENLLLEVAKGE